MLIIFNGLNHKIFRKKDIKIHDDSYLSKMSFYYIR